MLQLKFIVKDIVFIVLYIILTLDMPLQRDSRRKKLQGKDNTKQSQEY